MFDQKSLSLYIFYGYTMPLLNELPVTLKWNWVAVLRAQSLAALLKYASLWRHAINKFMITFQKPTWDDASF